ncbi:3-phosphoshikimate 1-carboxyvinyltransferase [Lachnospira multipara]|uniref:3-phosphoshikimate 1-carboxyvinyltransferase n=1 Tax=Lachnospira multipara TaxID=28051 RepID=A0A1H5X4A4_9FIRM|nr:3-phosphoshikimate 1-carboxyvinyltransferase [Lachnospira multipara]SEG06649.1 3-phosphoshikimate 1-carboxyvinyltransferase [Lachnospira multipara]
MSRYKVKPITHPFNAVVEVPGSKSVTNRALLLAALSNEECTLNGVLFSDDSRHFITSLLSLGFKLQVNEVDHYVTVCGCDGDIPKKEATIDVGSAGTAARFLTSMLALSDGEYTINASEQMKRRPMLPLFEALESLGASFTYLEEKGHLPVKVVGAKANGKTPESEVSIDISESTQFLSALLMTAPMLSNGLRVLITSKKTSGSYINITMDMMRQFGCEVFHDGASYDVPAGEHYRSRTYQIEPDVSAACYFYAAAAITGGRALVKNVHSNVMQGDMKFLDVLKQLGCAVTEEREGICVTGPVNGEFSGIDVDMNDFSDQSMTLAAIAPFARTATCIRNIEHIRLQESDRIASMVSELNNLGIDVKEGRDRIEIMPGKPTPGLVDTHDDHRMAMSFALIGLLIDGIEIDNYECCGKTFENYFHVLEAACRQ